MPNVIIADDVRLPVAELFGSRLKRLRREQNMTQAQLAELTGSTAAYVSQVERGNANPTLDVMARFCEVVGVDIWDLLKPDGD